MLNFLLQSATPARTQSLARTFRHLGAFGLFFLAILDSSPLPTLAGPDILVAILAATHRNPWYEYAAVATAGSVIGAYLTYRLAQKGGMAYLNSKFGQGRFAHSGSVQGNLPAPLRLFEKWGTGTLVASTAIPFPFPTSMFFAAAGASNFGLRPFIAIVAIGRGVRYSAIALVANIYGRNFTQILRHPTQHWGWLLIFTATVLALVAAGILVNKRLEAVPAAAE